jgi:hypothetical protein
VSLGPSPSTQIYRPPPEPGYSEQGPFTNSIFARKSNLRPASVGHLVVWRILVNNTSPTTEPRRPPRPRQTSAVKLWQQTDPLDRINIYKKVRPRKVKQTGSEAPAMRIIVIRKSKTLFIFILYDYGFQRVFPIKKNRRATKPNYYAIHFREGMTQRQLIRGDPDPSRPARIPRSYFNIRPDRQLRSIQTGTKPPSDYDD